MKQGIWDIGQGHQWRGLLQLCQIGPALGWIALIFSLLFAVSQAIGLYLSVLYWAQCWGRFWGGYCIQ